MLVGQRRNPSLLVQVCRWQRAPISGTTCPSTAQKSNKQMAKSPQFSSETI